MVQVKEEISKDTFPTAIPREIKPEKATSQKDVGDLLDDLVRKGRVTQTKNIYGFDWEISTLDQGELLDSQKSLPNDITDNLSKLYFLSIETLARSIKSINGIPVHQVFDVDVNLPNYKIISAEKVRNYLRKLSQVVVGDLFEAYTKVSEEANIKLEELKKK